MTNSGKVVIAGILTVSLAAALFGWWHQYRQGRRILELWGPEAAYLIRMAPDCALQRLPENGEGSGQPVRLTGRPGFVHARQALIQDASYNWEATRQLDWSGASRQADWTYALRFQKDHRVTRLWFDFDRHWVGEPDRQIVANLEPIGDGLKRFIDEQMRRQD